MRHEMAWAVWAVWAVGVLLAVAVPAAPALALDSDPVWSNREIAASNGDYTQHIGSDRYLAYDHYGTPGIVYQYTVNDFIFFRRRVEGTGWNTGMAFAGSPATSPTLVYDRHERPVIGYVNQGATSLNQAGWDGTVWPVTSVHDDAQLHASLALDLYGRMAMAWRGNTSENVRFIHDTDGDGDWAEETVLTVGAGWTSYSYPRLAFDGLNRPVVAYCLDQGAVRSVAVHVQDNGAWYSKIVVSDYTSYYNLSLAIDPASGYPALAYNNSSGDLSYAVWDNDTAVWQITALGKGAQPSLAFDPADGAPAIACTGDPGGNEFLELYYWDSDDLTWREQAVDKEVDVGYAPSLAFNPYGDKPLGIAYFSMGGTLYYIQDPPVVPEPATMALLLAGLGACALNRSRRRRQS